MMLTSAMFFEKVSTFFAFEAPLCSRVGRGGGGSPPARKTHNLKEGRGSKHKCSFGARSGMHNSPTFPQQGQIVDS